MPTRTDAFIIYVLIPILLTFLFFVLFNYTCPKASEKRWFATHGKRISAVVVKIDMRPQGTYTGIIYYYSVRARWKDSETGKTYLVKSGWVPRPYLKPDGNPLLSHKIAPGDSIEVLFDPHDPEHAMIATLPPIIYSNYSYYAE